MKKSFSSGLQAASGNEKTPGDGALAFHDLSLSPKEGDKASLSVKTGVLKGEKFRNVRGRVCRAYARKATGGKERPVAFDPKETALSSAVLQASPTTEEREESRYC
jgi:hypothetical protein